MALVANSGRVSANNHVRFRSILSIAVLLCLAIGPAFAQEQGEVKGTPAEPTDAAEVRQQIAVAEKLEKVVPDRGAVLYFRAVAEQHLGNTLEALKLLKECVNLREGFEPGGEHEFRGLTEMKEFQQLVETARRDFPAATQAHMVYESEEKDLVPEGLEFDSRRNVFYMSSLNRRKIVKITADDGKFSDFVRPDSLQGKPLLPVLGIRMDPRDGSIWANGETERGASELMHFTPDGALLGRYSLNDTRKHQFNDLVVRAGGEVILTDTTDNQVWRFDPNSKTFTPLKLYREVLFPNGIALADDDRQLFVADAIGVVRVDLSSGSSADVDPGPRNTVSQADGLYWHKGALIAVQNGIGSPRVAEFRLSKDGLRVGETKVLENRSPLSKLPATGAIKGNDFYFMTNTQIDNMNDDEVLDSTLLERIKIAVVHLP
jgi:hypothetical protein